MNEELSQEELTTKLARDMNRNPTGKGGFGERPQDINPGGKPANSMKSYMARKLASMTDEEKEKWLKDNKIDGKTQWTMAEGNPKQDTEIDATISGPGILRLDE